MLPILKSVSRINHLANKSFLLLLVVLAGALFFLTYTNAPYAAELSFIEYSNDSEIIGSVVPASCESSPPTNHFAGDCAVPPTPSTITVSCGVPVSPPAAASISWPASARASYYMVRLDYVGDPAPHLVQNDSYGATSFNFTPVHNTNYVTWVYACNVSGCSAHQAVNFNCPAPVIVDLSATPNRVDAGGSSNLVWTVSGATSCTASGGWVGPKSTSGGSENVIALSDTTYTISCTGPGGTVSRSATVLVPSGYIAATPCLIPLEGVACTTTVSWSANNFFSTPEISQGTTTFSNALVGPILRLLDPSNPTFTLRDSGGTFTTSYTADVQCAVGSVWAGARCVTLPEININADPNIVRSGNTAPVEIEITANYDLVCNLTGGVVATFNHSPSVAPVVYNYTTNPLTSARLVRVECTSPLYPAVTGEAEVRVEVIPTIQEI